MNTDGNAGGCGPSMAGAVRLCLAACCCTAEPIVQEGAEPMAVVLEARLGKGGQGLLLCRSQLQPFQLDFPTPPSS